MHSLLQALLAALLLAGSNGSDIEPTTLSKGDFVEITVVTFPNTATKCTLLTPSNSEIDLLTSEANIDKYQYLPNTLSSCRVRINDLDENDAGLWTLTAVLPSSDDPMTEQLKVAIEGTDSSNEITDDNIENIEDTILAKGAFVEITIVTFPNTASKCTLVTPSNSEIDLLASEANTDKYEYLPNTLSSCRVRINDLNEKDEGLWTLTAVLPSSDDPVTEKLKVVIKADDSSNEKSSENKSENSSENKSKNSSENKSENSSENKSENSSENKSEISSENKSENSSENKSENSSENKSENSSENKSEISSENKSENSSENKSENSSENKSENSKETADSEEASPKSSESTDSEEKEDVLSTESSEATSKDEESSDVSSSEEEQIVEEEWLSDLEYVTRTGLNVDINLPRTLNNEKCTLTKPDGTTVDVGTEVTGVTSHSSSDYVSCRVVVGPMDASLLGVWTLCGSYEENNVKHRRCQRGNIVWRNTANPGSTWQTTINPKFEHVVHYDGTLTPAVRGTGTVASCHLVTPGNEDLFVTRDREYANIRLVQDTDSACSIAIGPIEDSHLGDWTVYGTFNSALWGYNEVRFPFSMELYDKNHPYDQAYNVTTLSPIQHVVNLGSTIPVEVTSTGAVDVCLVTMPSGVYYESTGVMPAGVSFVTSHRVACSLSIGPITQEMVGEWELIGKFSNRDVYTENRLRFTIIREDPSNPIEEDRVVQYLDEQLLDTDIGASHRVVIASDIFATFQSCHIRTPEGLQYTIMEGFDIPGVEVVTGSNVACGVTIQVSEDHIGTWTLIAREIRSSQATERRLPINIYVEGNGVGESVEAVPNEITITEGNSIHVRLANPTDLHETCAINDPNGDETALASPDGTNVEACGFVVASVDKGHSGTWNIVYGNKIIYKAAVLVNVNAREDPTDLHLRWVEHSSLTQNIGPEDAVYCRVVGPRGDVVFDHFGRCQVTLDRVLMDQHDGIWTMVVGLPGRIVTETHTFVVRVTAADIKPEVATNVEAHKPSVDLTCSVTSSQQKTACLFRSPSGEVLVANQGVSEGRYAFHVNQTRIDNDEYYSCGLQLLEPATSDLGLWRCDLESEEENFYGFLTVLCPWAMQDPVVADAVVSEPILKPVSWVLSVEEREPATLSCSARAPLRYCYFRAPNGTVFNVGPGMSSLQYVGAGFDAGECGVRFDSLLARDSGDWSCHASIDGREQSHLISIYVQDFFVATSYRVNERLVVKAEVAGQRPLEYCRFVRFDGFGFSHDNPLFPYVDESDLTHGLCRMRVNHSALDLNPWTVVAKLQGHDGEFAKVTGNNWPEANQPVYYSSLFMWLPLMLIVTSCMLMAAALAPAKNRRWAAERATSMRASMRASIRRFPSLRKKPLPLTDTNPAA